MNTTKILRPIQQAALTALAFLALLLPAQAQFPSFVVTEAAPNIPSGVTNYVTDYGAVGDGISTNNAAAINSAILDTSTNGGGTVIIPFVPGTSNIYMCRSISMKKQTRLQIEPGVILRMFPSNVWGGAGGALITATANTADMEISGAGTLDGNAHLTDWWGVAGTGGKPVIMNISGCARVLVKDLTFINSPRQHIVVGSSATTNFTIENITIATDSGDSHNTDGIDIAGKNLLIKDCKISCGDDNIAMASSLNGLLVSNCVFGIGHGLSFGSDTTPGCSNVILTDCIFTNTDSGLRIKSDNTSGGPLYNIACYNLFMTNVNNSAITIYGYYPALNPNNSTPLLAAQQSAALGSFEPVWHDILISNLVATVAGSGNAGCIWGRTESTINNITMSHINITAAKTFNINNAYGIKFLDSTIKTTTSGQKTVTMWNAGVTFSNTVSGGGTLVYDGFNNTNNVGDNDLTLYNSKAAFSLTTNLYNINPIALSGSTLTVSNRLVLTNGIVVNFTLGTSNTVIAVRSNLLLNATLNVAAGDGFAAGTYTLFTYNTGSGASTLTPTLGTTPVGTTCHLDTSVPGEVDLVVSAFNNPPNADPATVYRHNGQPLHLDIGVLSPYWSDPDLNTVTFTSVFTPSTNGGDVFYDGVITINYTNASDLADQFSYVISDSLGATNYGVVNVIVTNGTPVATTTTYFRNSGLPLQIPLATLSTNWGDPESDPISLSSVDAQSANLVPLSSDANFIYYQAGYTNHGNDHFNYVISDAFGAQGSGTVNVVTVQNPPATAGTVNASAGTVTLNFAGTEGVTYWVQATTNLGTVPINWSYLSTNVAGAGGTWQVIDMPAGINLRYYRAVEAY